jgi:hypothetical protein
MWPEDGGHGKGKGGASSAGTCYEQPAVQTTELQTLHGLPQSTRDNHVRYVFHGLAGTFGFRRTP